MAGSRQLEEVSRAFYAAGRPSGVRTRLRRNIRAAVEPMKRDAQRNALAIPSSGSSHTGLRQAIARSIVIRTRIAGSGIAITLKADKSRMPAGQQTLPAYMEGLGRWRHPTFGDREVWESQESHPYFAPAVEKHLPAVNAAVLAAADETIALLRGA